jgi:hypothetical protein
MQGRGDVELEAKPGAASGLGSVGSGRRPSLASRCPLLFPVFAA